ncbi:M48 family metallopeptidase [Marinomonas sp. IMCC 4694]|uniref:M48 family metallopeptidase n=1 Tax=Marinomonas sp. IMCC 4694 TaxID=2605432 RepID=UPI0011E6CF35|nr:M48 family metalloprotease [Marinomonas sp. IMCC 4694]TYL48001.1 M48 family metalloprotease [Marinomonas sp. IMCC 4694]
MRLFLNVTTGLFILAVVFIGTVTHARLPDFEANQDERALSNPSYVLGQYWFRKLNGSQALIDFPPAYDYLKEAISYILPQTSLYNTTVEMTLLNSAKSNAFVMPGNHLYLYSDIMEMITSEDMLMGLLAHEIAHLDLRHYERQSQHSGEERQKTFIMLGAGIAAALAGADADATTALWLGGIANQAENTLTYSRNQEQEADRRGRDYLIDAQIAPQGMSQLFQAFFKQALGRPKVEFLSTHPSPESRMTDTFRIDSKDTILSRTEQSDFHYFRASVLAYRAGIEESPFTYLDQHIQDIDAKWFAKALLSYLNQSPERSLAFLTKIKTHNPFIDYIQALSYLAVDQKNNSSTIVQKRLDIDPNNFLFVSVRQTTHFNPFTTP